MKILERTTLLAAALAIAGSTVFAAEDTAVPACQGSSTQETSISYTAVSASPTPSELTSTTPVQTATASEPPESSASSSPETSSSAYESTQQPSSFSTLTITPSPSTTKVVVHMPTGRVNATSLEWTLVWRRCTMPGTSSLAAIPSTSTASSLSVSSAESPTSSLVP